MALSPRLDLRQTQSLVMTPQLQQAIRLLALSNMEIEAFIASEMERNPLLEIERDDGAGGSSTAGGAAEGDADADLPATVSAEAAADRALEGQGTLSDNALDVDYAAESFNPAGPSDAAGARTLADTGAMGSSQSDYGTGYLTEGPDFDSFASSAVSLSEHLMEQARQALSGTDLLIATQLIGQIDEAGYLEADLLQTAYALGVPRARVEEVLVGTIQTFDPVGVGARGLAECLELQAREADRFDPAMAGLIANLDLLARGALPRLRRICEVDEDDLADMIRELRGYDPKPGLRFAHDTAQTVIPDLFVTERADGWNIEINGATLPRLLVNRSYYTQLVNGVQDKASRAWLAECLNSANWLTKALDQRQRTIIRVATEIVRQQEAFFRQGVALLKPLTLRAVADAIGMHESTVSRVTSNKYLSCRRGLFELKYFFTSGISSTDGGEAVSAEAVKSRIRALIGAEDPRRILSDDRLVEMLRAEGFDIARRTVAKYREAMDIGSSVQRRRQRALAG